MSCPLVWGTKNLYFQATFVFLIFFCRQERKVPTKKQIETKGGKNDTQQRRVEPQFRRLSHHQRHREDVAPRKKLAVGGIEVETSTQTAKSDERKICMHKIGERKKCVSHIASTPKTTTLRQNKQLPHGLSEV